MTPIEEEYCCSLQQLPRLVEGLFELTWFPSRVLITSSRSTEKQGHTRRQRLKRLSGTIDANLDCVFVKLHFFAMILDCDSRIKLSW